MNSRRGPYALSAYGCPKQGSQSLSRSLRIRVSLALVSVGSLSLRVDVKARAETYLGQSLLALLCPVTLAVVGEPALDLLNVHTRLCRQHFFFVAGRIGLFVVAVEPGLEMGGLLYLVILAVRAGRSSLCQRLLQQLGGVAKHCEEHLDAILLALLIGMKPAVSQMHARESSQRKASERNESILLIRARSGLRQDLPEGDAVCVLTDVADLVCECVDAGGGRANGRRRHLQTCWTHHALGEALRSSQKKRCGRDAHMEHAAGRRARTGVRVHPALDFRPVQAIPREHPRTLLLLHSHKIIVAA